jgi:peptide/nickel transport system permease protein
MDDLKTGSVQTAEVERYVYVEENIESEIVENEKFGEKIGYMFKTNKVALVSFIVILLIILAAVFAPLLAPYNPAAVNLSNILQAPSRQHLLGTDNVGRDILSRLLFGARISLFIGIVPTMIALLLGTIFGLMSGFMGKTTDFIIMRLVDIMLSFPSLLLAMLIIYMLGQGMVSMFMALVVVGWARTARVVRSETLSLKEMEFVEAAKSLGVSKWMIMVRHILPNCVPSLIVLFTLNVPNAILSESMLSFLGMGIQPPDTSWGLMVNQTKQFIMLIPVSTIAPGALIMLLVLAFNFLGDGLRDAIDPYMKE